MKQSERYPSLDTVSDFCIGIVCWLFLLYIVHNTSEKEIEFLECSGHSSTQKHVLVLMSWIDLIWHLAKIEWGSTLLRWWSVKLGVRNIHFCMLFCLLRRVWWLMMEGDWWCWNMIERQQACHPASYSDTFDVNVPCRFCLSASSSLFSLCWLATHFQAYLLCTLVNRGTLQCPCQFLNCFNRASMSSHGTLGSTHYNILLLLLFHVSWLLCSFRK
jgi:hypothetical protein